jgi:hypothetical protein
VASCDLGVQHDQVLTANVDVGPYSTTVEQNFPPPTRDMRQRHESTEVIDRRVEWIDRKFEYREKDFRVEIVNRSCRVPFAVNP